MSVSWFVGSNGTNAHMPRPWSQRTVLLHILVMIKILKVNQDAK